MQAVRRVLIIDDDVEVASGIAELLRTYDYEVDVIHTGGEAVAAVAEAAPAVVVLDVQLPDIDGGQVFQNLRERWPALPIVFSSGHLRDLRTIGVTPDPRVDLLVKPYDGSALVEAIERVCAATE